MFYIEDVIHCEIDGPFSQFEHALDELHRRSFISWDQPPNRAPCTSWQTCRREYHVYEYDQSENPWKLLRKAHVLDISPEGVR